MTSLTVIIPAFNEEAVLADTLEALLSQTVPADRIIVVDDCSTDGTRALAESYGVEVVTPKNNLGSKARAQNFALPLCDTDLVLPVDADTVLASDYIEKIKEPFADPRVAVAAGCVQSRYDRTVWEKGRSTEYLFGFHWHRPIQNVADSPVVCSGCCSAFRLGLLRNFGGFPERTIVEDMDYTWSQQIAGMRAVYVGDAVAYAADPETLTYLKKQVWRWMAGFFQNVRIHYASLLRKKKMLSLWVSLAVIEIMCAPLWYTSPVVFPLLFDVSVWTVLLWWGIAEFFVMLPPLIYACRRRQLKYHRVIFNIPAVYANKAVNIYYAWKAMVVELVLVPCGLTSGLTDYEKGRA